MSKVTHVENIDDLNEKSHEIKLKELNDEFGAEGGEEMMDYITKFLGASEDARESENKDKQMTFLQAIKTYPKAAFWSVVLSSVLIMEGYDASLLGSFYAFPPFAERYGKLTKAGIYELSTPWQTGLSMCGNIGGIFGLQLGGVCADRFGYRKSLIFALFLLSAFIFLLFFATNIEMLAAGEFLCGIPLGFFQTLTISYANEVCPLVLRYYLTTYINLCWTFGQLISSGVLKGLLGTVHTQWAYKIPFAIQWAYPIPIAIGIYFAPEGPYWLVRKNKFKEAKQALRRLMTKNEHNPDPDLASELMLTKLKVTIENERAIAAGTSYWACFKGIDARRTRISVITFVCQNWTGSTLMGYSTYFYEKAGLNTSNAFTFTLIQYAIGITGILLSWLASTRFGRFQLFFTGISIQGTILLIVGGLGCVKDPSQSVSWAIGSLLLIFIFCYDVCAGPVVYCLVGEIPSSPLRTKTVVLARSAYLLSNFLNICATPPMLNTTKWNWGAKTGFFWAGFCACFLVWMWFDLPETKDRTVAELDVLFEKKVKARDFKNTEVDPFEAAALVQKLNKDQIERIIGNGDDDE